MGRFIRVPTCAFAVASPEGAPAPRVGTWLYEREQSNQSFMQNELAIALIKQL
jgi:hypothetical protein